MLIAKLTSLKSGFVAFFAKLTPINLVIFSNFDRVIRDFFYKRQKLGGLSDDRVQECRKGISRGYSRC